ncbi:hypothetical protein D5S17_29775 [Pseudonocardiaceae bacterium YIM PH 21723]|nr:hypothetical protein D5S17_29775 [Pseudonocardiaceae bacterium YIM PH 21723]
MMVIGAVICFGGPILLVVLIVKSSKSQQNRLARPLDVQMNELAWQFNGSVQVLINPFATAVPRDQILAIAQSRGYVFQAERRIGDAGRVDLVFVRSAPGGRPY